MARRKAPAWLARRAVQATFVVSLIISWHLATAHWDVSPLLLPKPAAVLRELADVLATGAFIPDLKVTLTELALAFALAATAGMTAGCVISRSPYWVQVFEPLLAAIYAIPLILCLPLYVVLFGLGPPSKIAFGATIGFFPIVLNTIAGFGNVDPRYLIAARAMGASGYQLFRSVLLPAALPVIVAGLRMGFTVTLLSILGAETIASLSGLGHRIVNLAEGMQMPRMFAFIVFAVGIAVALNAAVSVLERRAKRP